jgi:predicted metal-binding protein
MRPVEIYCEEVLEMGMDGAKVIDPGSVVTAEWVRMKCQYGCPGFGASLCCPPHTPSPDVTREVMDSYQKAILLHRRLRKGEKSKPFNETVVNVEIKIFLDGYYKA